MEFTMIETGWLSILPPIIAIHRDRIGHADLCGLQRRIRHFRCRHDL